MTTAQEIIQREGLSALTMRRLGEALHVDASAMYRHFANKSALLTALFEELFSSLEPPDPSQSWRKNLSTLMHTWWQIYRDNREIAAKLTKSPKADTGRTMLKQWVMTELARAGIRPDAQQQYGQLVWGHVMGYGLLAATQASDQQQVEEAFTLGTELLLAAIEEGSGHAQPGRD